MTTQVIFKIDQKLKNQAMKKAQDQGLTFSYILKLATKAYVQGTLDVQLAHRPKLNVKTRKLLIKELKDIKQNKNMSPVFNNAKDAIEYLNNL